MNPKNEIQEQEIAHSIFDLEVNAGLSASSKLAQGFVKAKADGVIGKNTLKAINAAEPEKFLAMFTVAKISRYISIIEKTPTSKKFLYGSIRRALGKKLT